jgi:Asp-tRNA(Asn)/Glu-tRNA(Gln) amidotransferase A subunit family amidase
LAAAGAVLVDPIEIPNLNRLLATRTAPPDDEAFGVWARRSKSFPYASFAEFQSRPEYAAARPGARGTSNIPPFDAEAHYQHLKAQDELMTNVLKVMADNQLDAIVHKTVEHQPTLIREGINPPYHNGRGAAHLNTFLIYAASLTVPAGFTSDQLPVGITFFGRPYGEPTLFKLGYAYEQSTLHRIPPASAPAHFLHEP